MATIKDIARLAKVTPSTVSRVLNHSGGYSEKLAVGLRKLQMSYTIKKTKLPLIWLHRPQI